MKEKKNQQYALYDPKKINEAVENRNVFSEIAYRLWNKGFSVLPLNSPDISKGKEEKYVKKPNREILYRSEGNFVWANYTSISATRSTMGIWIAESQKCFINYGIVCGVASMIRHDDTGDEGFLYVLDFDEQTSFDEFKRELAVANINPPIITTGNGGHIYFLSSQPIRTQHAKWRSHTIEVKGQGSYVVGPGSIHPNGVGYCIESQGEKIPLVDTFNIDGWLQLDYASKKELRPVLNEKNTLIKIFWDLHKEAEENFNNKITTKNDESATLQSFAQTVYNRDGREEDFTSIVKEQVYGHYKKKLTISNDEAERILENCWRNLHKADSEKFRSYQSDARKAWTVIFSSSCTSPTSVTDRLVMLSHLECSMVLGKPSYYMSNRQGAELFGGCLKTFNDSCKRLVQWGLIKSLPTKGTRYCSRWQINFERINELETNCFLMLSCTDYPSGVNVYCGSMETKRVLTKYEWRYHYGVFNVQYDNYQSNRFSITLDVFEHRGLGKLALTICELLVYSKPMTIKEIALFTSRNTGSISKKIQKMCEFELIKKNSENRYETTELKVTDFIRINRELRKSGKRCGSNAIKRTQSFIKDRKNQSELKSMWAKQKSKRPSKSE